MVQIIIEKVLAHLCLTSTFCGCDGNCTLDTKQSERELDICKYLIKQISNVI